MQAGGAENFFQKENRQDHSESSSSRNVFLRSLGTQELLRRAETATGSKKDTTARKFKVFVFRERTDRIPSTRSHKNKP